MDFNEYVGIPFADAGRDRAGCDCWGLVRLVLAERFGKTVPSFVSYEKVDCATTNGLIETGRVLVEARPVEAPEPGDVCIMRIRGIPAHIGVYIGSGLCLHTDRGTSSRIERTDSPHISRRIEGWYRV